LNDSAPLILSMDPADGPM